ncbi:MAG: M28 family peptidase [Candidatus Cloacimonetes bacterium]|nr:M28 family peptidase [Candidatus Cloacimonadota bacterium]
MLKQTDNCMDYLKILCEKSPDRRVGSEGNIAATSFFKEVLISNGWEIKSTEFDAVDWYDGGAALRCGDREFEVLASPYSNGCDVEGELVAVGTLHELETGDFRDKILMLHGELAQEQLMPKNFVFYNPEEHRRIISLLEQSGVKAIVCATDRNASLAGGVYPFPLIEDGDFDIPSVYMTEEEGAKLRSCSGKTVLLTSDSQRIPGVGYNVIGVKNPGASRRIVISAHIDSKKGSPGAIDNATGVAVMLLLSDLLSNYEGEYTLELVAFNGEDYYAVPGQMVYLKENSYKFDDVLLNINIDGAGYREGKSAFSLFKLPETVQHAVTHVFETHEGIVEGVPWYQGDHGIFLQYGVPAIAVSSKWFIDNVDTQEITHTPKDNLSIVNYDRIVEIAVAIDDLIRSLTSKENH